MGGVSENKHEIWLKIIKKFYCPFYDQKQINFLLNFYNPIDEHLHNSLPIGNFLSTFISTKDPLRKISPLGLYEIEIFSPQMKNIDCSSIIGSDHDGTDYLTVVAYHKSLKTQHIKHQITSRVNM